MNDFSEELKKTGVNPGALEYGVEQIKWMAWNASWYAANIVAGDILANIELRKDAVEDYKRFYNHYESIGEAAMFEDPLIVAMKDCAYSMAWKLNYEAFPDVPRDPGMDQLFVDSCLNSILEHGEY